MRMVLSRAAAARTLLVAAGAAALVTTVLLTAFVQYASLLPLAGVRAALVDAPPPERTITISASAGADEQEFTEQDAAVRALLADGVAGVPLEVTNGGYAVSQQLPAHVDADALVTFLPDLPERATLNDGQWPQAAGEDEPVQVVLPAEVADELGYAVGDEVIIHDGIASDDRLATLSGVWRPNDDQAAYWQLINSRIESGMVGPFVVHPDDFTAHFQMLATLLWLAEPDPADMAAAGMANVRDGVRAMEATLLHQRATDPAISDNARLATELDALGDQLVLATVVNRSGLVLPAALLAVIAGYGLVLVARLLVAHRRGENALLRARGASRRQLVRYTVAEALLVVAPATLLAAPLGTALVSYADGLAGDRSLGIADDLAPYGLLGPPLAWVIAVLAGLACAVALAAPAASRGRTWVAEQQERSRPGKLAVVQRAGTDVALLGLAVLAWTQLRQYGSAVTPRDVGGLGIDPLLVAAPVVGVLAATTLALRLLPLATRMGVRLASRRDTFPGLLGMWQADRRPQAGPVLLLVLAMATAVLAPSVAATWQQSQRDQAAQLVGTDLRVASSDPRVVAEAGVLAELPEVDATMVARRSTALLPEGVRSTMLALDSGRAAEVTQVRDDLGDNPPAELFKQLHDQRPELEVMPLPDGATSLTGQIDFVSPESITVDIPGLNATVPIFLVQSHRLTIYTVDEHGVISPLRLSAPEPGEPLELDVALPAGTVAVVGLSGGITVRSTGFLEDGQFHYAGYTADVPEAGELSWTWDLGVSGDDGDLSALELPATWEVGYPPGVELHDYLPTLVGDSAGAAVSAAMDPAKHRGGELPFLFSGPLPDPGPVPAVVTADVLAATGTALDQVVTVGNADLHIVDTMSVLPGTADGSGLAVDLPWLSLQQFRAMHQAPQITEWWVTTSATGSVSDQATGIGLQVVDQHAEAQRLLGDPLGTGVLLSLWTAAAAAALLAAFGLAVDSRANAVRRGRELAVLHTLGASPPALARALVVEQAVLAGLGVLAGVAVGFGVSAAMGTSLVLTPSGGMPVPEPLLALSPTLFAVPTIGLFTVAVVLGALVARRARRDIAAGALRIGED